MLKVLVSAYACEPNTGSESGIGWSFVQHVGRLHELWVITRSKNRESIEAAIAKAPLPNVHWIYYDFPLGRYVTWKGTRFVYAYHHYVLWQVGAYFAARKLNNSVGFDLVHHVTFVNYWLPTLMPLLQVPFVWGPVGGGEMPPNCMTSELGVFAKWAAGLRRTVQKVSAYNPAVRYAAKRAAWTLATTPETAERLRILGTQAQVLPAVALAAQEIARLQNSRTSQESARPRRFRVISVGDLLPVKAFATAIRAFAEFHRACPESEYWIVGEGHERRRLARVTRELGLQDRVIFWGRMPREKVLERLAHCDALVFPSLHESGGWVSLEAMAAGLPVICLNHGGPALQVTHASGFKIAAMTPKQVTGDIAEALTALYRNPKLREEMGLAGRERVKKHFSWDQKARQISQVYEKVVGLRGCGKEVAGLRRCEARVASRSLAASRE